MVCFKILAEFCDTVYNGLGGYSWPGQPARLHWVGLDLNLGLFNNLTNLELSGRKREARLKHVLLVYYEFAQINNKKPKKVIE